jgi:hypothetical protein
MYEAISRGTLSVVAKLVVQRPECHSKNIWTLVVHKR